MADEYSVIYDNSLIIKNGRAFGGFDVNFLPDNVLAIQINSNGEADLEKGDRATLEIFENEFIKDVNSKRGKQVCARELIFRVNVFGVENKYGCMHDGY